jgi:hypothetical protein
MDVQSISGPDVMPQAFSAQRVQAREPERIPESPNPPKNSDEQVGRNIDRYA